MKKVYLSPSSQTDNKYAYGNTTEAVQCGKIADACAAALKRSGIDVKVGHMITLKEKCSQSDSFGADIHVPIHTNAYNKSVSGTRLMAINAKGEGYKACKAIYNRLAPLTPGTSENISSNSNLYEINVPKAPTAYIEVDFHDVYAVAKWIVEHTTEIGETIAHGICDYLGVTYKAPVKEESKPATSGKIYRVQVGAFSNYNNAKAMQTELKKYGFDGIIKEG